MGSSSNSHISQNSDNAHNSNRNNIDDSNDSNDNVLSGLWARCSRPLSLASWCLSGRRPRSDSHQKYRFLERRYRRYRESVLFIWVVVKIMVPLWIPIFNTAPNI